MGVQQVLGSMMGSMATAATVGKATSELEKQRQAQEAQLEEQKLLKQADITEGESEVRGLSREIKEAKMEMDKYDLPKVEDYLNKGYRLSELAREESGYLKEGLYHQPMLGETPEEIEQNRLRDIQEAHSHYDKLKGQYDKLRAHRKAIKARLSVLKGKGDR